MDSTAQDQATHGGADETAGLFAAAARVWFPGHSNLYAQWAAALAADTAMLRLVSALPGAARNPLTVFAAARYLGCPEVPYAQFAAFLREHWAAVADVASTHWIQTNEVGRCTSLLPALARIAAEEGRPLALVEAGASAGLCLLPDLYSYSYDGGPRLGEGEPLLECTTSGNPPLPDVLPEIVWRAGVDLHPLNGTDPDTVRWLESLVWPGEDARLARLRAALSTLRTAVERGDGPRLVAGDAIEGIAELVAAAPAGSVPVVVHSALLAYLSPADRQRFGDTVRALGCRWVSNESYFLDAQDTVPGGRKGYFTLALDGVPLAHTGQHGAELHWL
jgi:hypothetical protein